MPETPLDYFCVMDIEATCEAVNPENYIHEPIELPVSVISTTTKQVVSFQRVSFSDGSEGKPLSDLGNPLGLVKFYQSKKKKTCCKLFLPEFSKFWKISSLQVLFKFGCKNLAASLLTTDYSTLFMCVLFGAVSVSLFSNDRE